MKQKTITSGKFGEFGGQFVPEALMTYLNNLEKSYEKIRKDANFTSDLEKLLQTFVGRPSPLYYASRLSSKLGFKVYLKREDLNHTGAHKINNTLGQAMLAKTMGKKEMVAETGAGQHGVATATAAALLGMNCTIFQGEIDVEKQKMNEHRMRMLGADVRIVKSGTRTLKDAVDEAIKYLIENPDVFYLLGSVVGPHPYPTIVRDFQKIIGIEAKEQILKAEGRLPDALIACVGGGSNAMGLFYDFLKDKNVRMIGVEPAGLGLKTGKHAATMTLGSPGVIHGFKCLLLQDENGQPLPVHSIASGLDYPGVGPEPSMLKSIDRLECATATDKEALEAFHLLSRLEGIIPALESSHALAYLLKAKDTFTKDHMVVLNLSGRGDKDVETVLKI